MVLTTMNVSHGHVGAAQFLWKRVTRIYPPYLVITAIIFVLYLVRPELVNSGQEVRPDIVAAFLLFPQAGLPLLLVGWTLVYEMYFYLVFTIAILAPKAAMPFIFGAWALTPTLLSLIPTENPWVKLAASPLNYEFLLGVVVAIIVLRGEKRWARLSLALGLTVLAAMLALSFTGKPFFGNDWLRVATAGLAFAAIVYATVVLEGHGRTAPRTLVHLGNWSYSLYLVHLPVLGFCALLMGAIGMRGTLSPIALAVALATALTTGWLYFRLIESPAIRIAHMWQPFSVKHENPFPMSRRTSIQEKRSARRRSPAR